MIFIGDVHGRIPDYYNLVNKMDDDSLQVGDFGFGFQCGAEELEIDPRHKIIRGNHDNPQLARSHPNYLMDCGYIEEMSMFVLAGAWSIDCNSRTQGFDFWKDEELSYSQLQDALILYQQVKPRIVVSHECPTVVKQDLIKGNGWGIDHTSRTEAVLQLMFDYHQPDEWVFGHYHKRIDQKIGNTNFHCTGQVNNNDTVESYTYQIEGLKWPMSKI